MSDYFKNPITLQALFGEKAMRKLRNLLDPCCGSNRIYIDLEPVFQECDASNTIYQFNITSNTAIQGATSLVIYTSLDGVNFSTSSNFAIIGMEANIAYTTYNSVSLEPNTLVYAVVVDFRGNYSDVISFTTETC